MPTKPLLRELRAELKSEINDMRVQLTKLTGILAKKTNKKPYPDFKYVQLLQALLLMLVAMRIMPSTVCM